MAQETPFKWRQYAPAIILLCVRGYLRYSLSYRDLAEMMAERGLGVDHTSIYRWVQRYAPELEQRIRPQLKPTNDSWRVDETYIKVYGEWAYLYRAVDSAGNTVDFVLSPDRAARSAAYFFRQVRGAAHTVAPRVVTGDQNAAYPPAFQRLQDEGALTPECELRPVKYLNNIVEQDHRFLKRRVRPGLEFRGLRTAWATLRGYAAMNQLRKGHVAGTSKRDIIAPNRCIARSFGLAA